SGRVPVGGAPLGCRRRSERCANFHPLGHRRRSATCSRPASPAVGGVAGHALGPEVPTSDVVVAELPQPPDDHGRAGRADDALAFIDASLPVSSQPVMGGVVPAGLPGTTSPLVRLGVARAASLATGEDRGAGDRAATHLVPSGAPPACHAHLPRTHAEGPGHSLCPGPPGRTTAPTCDTLPDLVSHPPAYLVRRVTPPSMPGRSRGGRRRCGRATGASGRATARTRR